MSGVAIIRALLAANARLIATVPATRIKAGDLPLSTVLPAISVKQISSIPRLIVSGDIRNTQHTDRVQVSGWVKGPEGDPAGDGYPGVRSLMALVFEALGPTRGIVNGFSCDSVTPDLEGPDLSDTTRAEYGASRDYIVKWNTPAGLPILLATVSRKQHANGVFDITLDPNQAITGNITVEPRTNAVAHQIIFIFDRLITNSGTMTCKDSTGAAFGTATKWIDGNSVVVNIAGAPDLKRARITLAGVNGSVAAAINVGFLIGDQNDSRTITGTDTGIVNGRQGQTTTAVNFKSNINLGGIINAADLTSVQNNSGLSI